MSLLLLTAKKKFSPYNWFKKGEEGAWYDPSDLTTLFQDSAGTTPVTLSPMEQPVGLMRDKSGRGNHAFQSDATPGKRPLLSARVNLLTKTEDFSDGVWTRTNAPIITPNQAVAPDGTMSADLITGNGSSGIYSAVSGSASFPNTKSVWLRTVTGTAVVNIKDPSLTIVTKSCSLTTTWARFELSEASNYSTGFIGGIWVDGISAVGIYIWGADFRPTNSGALLPAYQRVNTATDYDTVGFPLYLKCNGTSSAMSTNSINFTATDKMTVVAGVRKLSDSVLQVPFELSASYDLNANAFVAYIAPPERFGFKAKGTTSSTGVSTTNSSYDAPIAVVYTAITNIASPFRKLRVLGADVSTSNETMGIGNFGNYPLYLFARNQALYFLNGNFYGAIIRGAQSDTASVTQTENYMAKQTGITF